VLASLVALAGCQNVAEPAATNEIGTVTAETSVPAYPSLYTVPPRPQLSYTVQQEHAIVDGLVADRANARYTDQAVRYRTGRSTLPPPPAPAVVATSEPEAPAKPAPSSSHDKGSSSKSGSSNNADDELYSVSGGDTLGGFLDRMVRDTAPQSAPANTEGAKSGGSGWFNWLRELFGKADEPAQSSGASQVAGSPAVAPKSPPPGPGTPTAAAKPIDAGPPPEAEAALGVLVAETGPVSQPAPSGEPPATPQPAMAPAPADPEQPAAGGDPGGQTLIAAQSGEPVRSALGIAIGNGKVAIEGGTPGAQPAPLASTDAHAPAATLTRTSISASDRSIAETSAGRVAFAPGSAELPAGVDSQLEQVLASAQSKGDLIRIVGEADAPALALDRARAVAIALVRLGARAGDIKMTLAPGASGDQARLLLAPPAAR
jgi:hypothetical protein